LVAKLRDEFGRVDVGHQTGGFERRDVFLHGHEVAVGDEEGEDFVAVLGEPVREGFEGGLEGSGVEEVATGMAVVDGVVDVVRPPLDCDTSVSAEPQRCEFDVNSLIRTPSYS
jgi:hypothetical protein